MQYAAILFDLDGTLVETVDLYGQAVRSSFAAFGIEMSETQYESTYSLGLHLHELMEMFGIDRSREQELRNLRDENYMRLLRTRTAWKPDAEALLASVADRPKAIITGSWRKYVDAIHEAVPILDYFETIICADEIHHAMKPSPFGLQLAAKRLGFDPRTCVYIGDQPFDIEAADRSGMESILIRGKHTPQEIAVTPTFETTMLTDVQRYLAAH